MYVGTYIPTTFNLSKFFCSRIYLIHKPRTPLYGKISKTVRHYESACWVPAIMSWEIISQIKNSTCVSIYHLVSKIKFCHSSIVNRYWYNSMYIVQYIHIPKWKGSNRKNNLLYSIGIFIPHCCFLLPKCLYVFFVQYCTSSYRRVP